MTLSAIKEEVRLLKPKARMALMRYLHCLQATADPGWERQVQRAMANYQAGRFLTREEARAAVTRSARRGARRSPASKAA